MITLELTDVEIDHCVACGGIWLDAGELELLLGDPGQARNLLGSFREERDSAEQVRRCPICGRKMAKIAVGERQGRGLIDKCGRNHGLWFDRGELESVLSLGGLDQDSRIQGLLRDMFGGSPQQPAKEPQP